MYRLRMYVFTSRNIHRFFLSLPWVIYSIVAEYNCIVGELHYAWERIRTILRQYCDGIVTLF